MAGRRNRRGSAPEHQRGAARHGDGAVQRCPDRGGDRGPDSLRSCAGRPGADERRAGAASGGADRREQAARLQARRGDRGADVAVGDRLPAGRPHARDGTQRRATHDREGRAAAEGDRRDAGGLDAAGWRTVRRRGRSGVCAQRLDLSVVLRGRSERQFDDGDRPRPHREGQVDRSAGALSRAGVGLLGLEHALRVALHLRSAGTSLLLDRRPRPRSASAGSVDAEREGASHQRGRLGAARQSVRRPRRTRRRRSGATVTAIRRASRFIPSPASCGKRSMGRRAATR